MARLLGLPARFPGLSAPAAYLLLTCVLSWPLPLQLGSAFLGPVSGDLGVYVWNIWIFSHEALEHGRLPFATDHVFAFTDGADFSLHNYTPVAGLLAMPLLPRIGLIATFNVLLLGALATSAWAVFRLGQRVGLRGRYAWLAGAIFIASPVMSARTTAHVSLVAVAAIPLFLVAVLNVLEAPRLRTAMAIGALVAVAMYSDAYFAVYCLLAGLFLVAWSFLRVEVGGLSSPVTTAARVLWAGLLVAVVVTLASLIVLLVAGPVQASVGPLQVSITGLHNQMLAVVALGMLYLGLRFRPHVRLHDAGGHLPRLLRLAGVSTLTTLVLLSPLLAGLAARYVDGRLPSTPIFWRSSPRGVDLLAYFVPNPAHPWIGRLTGQWFLPPFPDAFPEYVAAFPLAAWMLIALGLRSGVRPRLWLAFTAGFMLLSLGPFVHVAGLSTDAIAPWALLRYVPVIGLARSPARFAIMAAIGLSLLTACAVQHLLSSSGGRRRLVVLAALVALTAEVIPLSRATFRPQVPDVYRVIAADTREEGHLLELPAGIRDGASSIGDFNAESQFFQTVHRRPLIGGYLSRVSDWRKRESQRAPVLRGLFALSEPGGTIPPSLWADARASRERFLSRSCVRYVVVNRGRASAELRAFAVDVLGLVSLYDDGERELLVPLTPPACEPRMRGTRWLANRRPPVMRASQR